MEPLEFVSSQPPFDALDDEDVDLLARHLEGVYFPAGARILERGGPPSAHVYVVRKGSLRLWGGGPEPVIVEEGEFFGHPSVLSGDAPTADVIADEDVLAYRIPKDTFEQLLERPGVAAFFLATLPERLRRFSDVQTSTLGVDFASPVASLITRPPLFVDSHDTVKRAAALMRDAHASSVLVSGDPQGIVTDRDLRSRVVAEGLPDDTPARAVMSTPLKSLSSDEPLFTVLLFMLEENIHHVPVTRDGRIIGVATDTDLLRRQGKSPLYLLKRVQKMGGGADGFDYSEEIAAVAESMLTGGLNVGQIARVITSLNDTLVSRMLRVAEGDLGPPPCSYTWVVFGSEGRREQVLLTDQDSALIFEEDSEESREYFVLLGRRVVEGLVVAGFPPCPGGFTADRLVWSLRECRRMFAGWIEVPGPEAVLDSSVLFDFRPVHRTLSLAPLDQLVTTARASQVFMAHLARQALHFKPPVTVLRRIKADDEGIDIKRGGITPIVNLGRLYGLQAASMARSTWERLAEAARGGVLTEQTAETLSEALLFMLKLRLERQIAELRMGKPPGNHIDLKAISPLERQHLKEGFLFLREVQVNTAQRFDTARLA